MPGSSLHNILSNLFSTPNFLGPDPRLAFWFEMKSKYPDLSDELINQMYSQLDVLDFNNLMGAASNVELPMLQEADLYSLNNTITLLSTDNLSKGALAILNGNLGASGENEESSTKGDKSLNINWNPNDDYSEWRELYVEKHATKKDSEGNEVANENAERDAKRWTNAARTMKWVGLGSDIVSSFLPENTAYSGDKGEVASTIDQAYDSATNFLANLGPYGLIASGALKGLGALNKGLSALGVGTDGMTTMDSLMSSNLFGWNIGLVNSLGAKTTDKINKDYDTFALSGSSYTGTSNLVDEAVHKSDKKYGLFSGGAYNRALELIHNAQLQLQKLSDITKAASNRSALKSSMSGTNTVRRQLAMNGGYRQGSVRAGLRGMILMPRVLIANILNAAKGAKVNIMNKYGDNYQGTTEDGSMKLKNPYYQQYDTSNIISLPMPSATLFDTKTDTGADDNWFKGNQILRGSYVRSMLEGSSITPVMPIFDDGGLLEYDNSWIKEVPVIEVEDFDKLDRVQLILALIDAVKNMANPPRFILRLNEPPHGIWVVNNGVLKRASHIISSGIYEDMPIVVPLILEIDGKLVFIDDMREAVGRALESGNYLRFVNNELAKLFGDNYKIGWPELFNNYDEDVIMENEMPEKFLHGGKTNVIPDGALHKERHRMEKMDGLEDVTRKGIPVVSEEEGGEIVQQAEIERSELILRLEVTEKIEELYKTYYDDKSSSEEKDAAAIDAGKLLAEEIMHNTDDLTNNII